MLKKFENSPHDLSGIILPDNCTMTYETMYGLLLKMIRDLRGLDPEKFGAI